MQVLCVEPWLKNTSYHLCPGGCGRLVPLGHAEFDHASGTLYLLYACDECGAQWAQTLEQTSEED